MKAGKFLNSRETGVGLIEIYDTRIDMPGKNSSQTEKDFWS